MERAPWRKLSWWIGAAAVAVAGGLGLRELGVIRVSGSKGSAAEGAIAVLARKWGGVFGVPEAIIMTIASIESSFHPDTVNLSERAVPLGGAWGPLQVTLTTAKGIAKSLAGSSSADVRATLARWDGTGEGLNGLDHLDVGVMFGAYYLGKLVKEFGPDIALVSGAYQQGPGKIRQVLAAGGTVPDSLPEHGKAYVTSALERYGRYA